MSFFLPQKFNWLLTFSYCVSYKSEGHTAIPQQLHFMYLVNRYTYWIFETRYTRFFFPSIKCHVFHSVISFGYSHFTYILFFILLMAGTLSVYHWPMRPIKVKHREKKLHFKKERGKKQKRKKTFKVNIKS